MVRRRSERRGPTIYPCGIGAASSNCQCFTGCLASAIRYRPLEPRLQRVPPRTHPGPTPGPPLQNTLTLHPTSPWLSAPWPLILAPSCFVTHPSSVILFILMTGWWEGPRDLPPGGYKWCLCLAPGESLLGPFRSR